MDREATGDRSPVRSAVVIGRSSVVALVVVLSACATGVRAPSTPSYLTQLEPIAREVNDAIADMRAAIDEPHESDDLFVNAIIDERLRTRLAIERDRLRRLEPDDELVTDHKTYVAMLGELQRIADDLDAALVRPDRVAAALAVAELESTAATAFSALPPRTCRFTTFDFALCADASFFTVEEATAHDVVAAAAIALEAYGTFPVSLGGGATDYGLEALSITLAALDEVIEVIGGLSEPEVRRLLPVTQRMMEFLLQGGAPDSEGSAWPPEVAVSAALREICRNVDDFPRPDPIPAEGGETVQIAGWADVLFDYAGRCER